MKRTSFFSTIATLLIGGFVFATACVQVKEAATLPISVSTNDARIRYVGRFDTQEAAGPRCSWSASRVILRFDGSALNARLSDTSNGDAYQIVIDDKPQSTLTLQNGSHLYSLFQGVKMGSHTVELVKRTESSVGVTQFEEFQLSHGGKLLAPPAPAKRRIEVIGDSISCGYGNEGESKDHFLPATENAYRTYGSIASRAVGADYVCIAWSGKKMWPDNTMNELYDRILATDGDSKWDFAKWTPDVVVVALGTNDFRPGIPKRKEWVAGYRAFLARVHKNYPKAAIYCATSPMTWGDQTTTLHEYLQTIISEEKTAGFANVRILEFAPQDPKDGLGADWHPNFITQTKMSEVLLTALNKDMGWKSAN